MVDDEVVGQVREVTGQTVVSCDFCGQPVPRTSLLRVAGVSALSEPVEALHVCDACRARIKEGEIPFDEEIAAGLQAAEE
jgi:hypothetical protein